MTKDIVMAHGGEISVRNRDAGGACFEIRLKREVKKIAV
jgi:signal transduction histidine kinase